MVKCRHLTIYLSKRSDSTLKPKVDYLLFPPNFFISTNSQPTTLCDKMEWDFPVRPIQVCILCILSVQVNSHK